MAEGSPDSPANPGGAPAFAGKVSVVTGGAQGIGRAIVLALAGAGSDVVVLGRDRDRAVATAGEAAALGVRAVGLAVDVTSRPAVDGAFEAIVEEFGGVDVLVNNAGHSAQAPLLELAEDDWDSVFRVNATGTFLASVAAARGMKARGGGSIVNIAGASAHRCYPGAGAYGPAKAAVVNLTRQMAIEWAPFGIRVNGVSPGPIRDPETGWQSREPELAAEVGRLPIARAGTTQEVARAVLHLAGPEATYTTGQMLIVDGGGALTWYLTG